MADFNTWPQIRAIQAGGIWQPAGGVFAFEGTVYPGAPFDPVPLSDDHLDGEEWSGFASGVVGGVNNIAPGLFHLECPGYPAKTANMGASVAVGVHDGGLRIDNFAKSFFAAFGFFPPIFAIGWSQGAWLVDMIWRTLVLPENGPLHYLKDYFWSIYNLGDVFRCSAISRGNDYGGFPLPGEMNGKPTGGIACIEQLTPDETNVIAPDGRYVIKSFNRKGDLYGAAPDYSLAEGKVEYSFFKMIESTGFFTIVGGVMGDLIHIIGDVEAGYNAAKFFSAGTNAPHFQYWDEMNWIISDIVRVGNSLPHSLGV